MERPEDRKMLYKFYSEKNNRNMYVHSRGAMEYATELEAKEWVQSYETNVILEADRLSHIPMHVSDDDLGVEWTTDFVITHVDGHRIVKEIVQKNVWQMYRTSCVLRCPAGTGPWMMMEPSG